MTTIRSIDFITCGTLESGVRSVPQVSSQGVINHYRRPTAPNNLAVARKCGETRGFDTGYSDTYLGGPGGEAWARTCVATDWSTDEGNFWLYAPRGSSLGGEISVMRFPIEAGTRGYCHEDLASALPGSDYISDCAVRQDWPTYGFGLCFGAAGFDTTFYRWNRSGELSSNAPGLGLGNPITVIDQWSSLSTSDYEYVDIDDEGAVWIAGQVGSVNGGLLRYANDGNFLGSYTFGGTIPPAEGGYVEFLDAVACYKKGAIVAGINVAATNEYDTYSWYYIDAESPGESFDVSLTYLNPLITVDGQPYEDWATTNGEFIDPESGSVSVFGDRLVVRTTADTILTATLISATVVIAIGSVFWTGS